MMWIHFLVYGLMGWGLEILWTGFGSLLRQDVRLVGTTYLWMFPIYGLAAPVFEPFHFAIAGFPWPIRGVLWTLAIFTVEFCTGWMLKALTGTCPWDYTGARFAVLGFIRLDYAPCWFVLGLVFEQLHLRLVALIPYLEGSL